VHYTKTVEEGRGPFADKMGGKDIPAYEKEGE